MIAARGSGTGWLLVAAALMMPAVPSAASEPRWDLRLTLEQSYDDNILQLSDRDIARLENQGPGSDPERFSIDGVDDFITSPRLRSSLRFDALGGRPTTFVASAALYRYLDSGIKDYESYRASLTQALHAGRAHPTSLHIAWQKIPYYYLRNLRSDRAAEETGVLPPPRREATYDKEEWTAHLEQDLVAGRVSILVGGGKERRDFNRFFDERDSQMPFGEGALTWYPGEHGRWRLRLGYRRENLHAAGDVVDTPSFIDDDISSRRDIVSGQVRLRWAARRLSRSLTLDYETEGRDYQTTDPNDITHFGRNDRRHDLALTWRADLRRGVELWAEAAHVRNRSDFPGGGVSDPNDVTDYDQSVISLGLAWEIGLAGGERRKETP